MDISEFHYVNDYKPLRSVWLVVDAIHQCPELNTVFLETHAEQTECANMLKKNIAYSLIVASVLSMVC